MPRLRLPNFGAEVETAMMEDSVAFAVAAALESETVEVGNSVH